MRRTFAPEVIDQLSLIALSQAAGFALDEIKGMVSGNGRKRIDRGAL